MTDLTGPELDLAVARAMGRPCGLGELVAGYPHTVTCFSVPTADTALVPLSRYEWRPDQGGAAAWEVWVWLVAQCHGDAEIAGALVADQQLIADDYAPENVPTYTCRAVVALAALEAER